MARSAADENPWIFVHEMRANGCHEAPASPVGNGTTKTLGKPSTNEDPSVTVETNATSSFKSRTLPPENKHGQYPLMITRKLELAELNDPGYYNLQPVYAPRNSSFAMPPEYQPGSFNDMITGSNVPRCMSNNSTLDRFDLDVFRNQSEAEDTKLNSTPPRRYSARRSQPNPRPSHQGTNHDENALNRKTPLSNGPTHTKQDSQDVQSMPAPEYRQFDIHQNTEEDAETDEELSQDPNSNKRDCREGQARD